MEAPEKIYVRPRCFEASWPPYVDENSNYGGIEYVQADAFIEKATKWLDDHMIDYMEFDEYSEMLCGFDEDKMLKDFVKYMKGE